MAALPLTGALLLAGCASPGPAPPAGPRVSRDDLPFLLPPTSGYPGTADAELLRRVDAAYQSRLLDNDAAGAAAAAEAALAIDPNLAPAQVLLGQARLIGNDPAAARQTLDAVVARLPGYLAAQLAAGRAAEKAGDLVAAYGAYRGLASSSSAALERAGVLHDAAVGELARRIDEAVGKGRLDDARAQLLTLEEWAPGARVALAAAMGVARAGGDAQGELEAVRGLLAGGAAGDESLLERRGELELQVGRPSAAIDIFEDLARRHPEEPRHIEQVDRAKFRWRIVNLPADVQRLVEAPELSRADYAVLLYWLVPGVRAAVVTSPHIASDILEHPRRQEVMRVVNLQLMDLDETLRRFNPDWRVHRAHALKALLRVLQRAQPAPSCVGGLEGNPSPSREAVCTVAAACGLLPEAADCLPDAVVSGGEAAAWIRRTVSLLP
ncbi:MAG TPA: hypothetical protein VGV61_14640 [Thermoanaerobaculia bacterium]|nr:hypothetical protein [Thermoanaerobaculia bacterium]